MFGLSFPPAVLESNFAFSTLTINKCSVCGTISYSPMICGDAGYYDYLSRRFSWYYPTTRWEYPIVASLLEQENPELFLEVGCGAGHFLRLARSRGYEGHGCEMNPQSVETLRSEGFKIFSELDEHLPKYNALLMFQVLEHLVDPYSFLKSLIPHLQDGGIVVFSTPVTPSCVAWGSNPFLVPPHHQWLPTIVGFKMFAERLDLVCEAVICDPPNSFEVEYGLKKRFGRTRYLRRNFRRSWQIASRITLKLAAVMECDWAKVGHTGMAVFRKPS